MARSMWLLTGLAALAASGYAYREQLGPFVPQPLASVVKSVVGIDPAGDATKGEQGKAGSNAKAASAAMPPSKKGGGGPAPVTTAVATLSDMPIVLSAPGTVEPLASVAIKPRVDGQVVEVGFKEGDYITAGHILYRLDDRLVRAQIKQAEAQIARDEASLKDAMAIADRRETLFQKRIASEAAAETARQNVEVLKASIAAGQAMLEAQRTQLDYLIIRAPIAGRTGSMTAKLGAFVRSADPAALLTINQTKPIAVAFALPQPALHQLKSAMNAKAEARVTVPGPKPLTATGALSFVDNQIDKSTGTVTGKLTVANETETLWPGQAVSVDLTVETRKNIVSVPASAVMPAQQGMIVWVIGSDSRVSVRPVTQDRVIGQTAYITAGLKEGERVVTDGQLRLSSGATVAVRDGKSGVPQKGSGKGPQIKSGQDNAGGG